MALSSWVDCLVSIRFDLDIGPKIESVFPPNAITEEGKRKLLHCAFPDCNPDCGYNFIFYFTMPDCTMAAAQSFSQTVAPPTTGNTVPELYGAAFYRQKHDPNVPRRYVQQVVVLLSHLPYYNVHELILRVLAPRFCQCCALSPDTGKVPVSSVMSPVPEAYFEMDQSYTPVHYTQEEVLRDAMQELAQWPSPHPQVRYSVNLLQQALVFLTPTHSLRSSVRATSSGCAALRKSMNVDERVEFMEVVPGNARYRGSSFGNDMLPLFSLLGEQLHHLTYIWELLLRHEPLFILSNTPSVASATAFSIASLILPIQFNGTLRSYFTVQNEDFPRFSRMGKVLPFPTNKSLIVAGTNPFLLRSFSGWPSLLVVMDRNTTHVVNGSVASPCSSAATSMIRGNRTGAGGDSGGRPGTRQDSLIFPSSSSSFTPSKPMMLSGSQRVVIVDEQRGDKPPLPTHCSATSLHASPKTPIHNYMNSRNDGSSPASPSAADGETAFNCVPFPGSSANMHGAGGVAGNSSNNATIVPPGFHYDLNHTHVKTASFSTGNGLPLSAIVRTPTSMKLNETSGTATTTASTTPEPTAYQTDPHAAYALESSSDSSEEILSLRSLTPASRHSSSATPAAVTITAATTSDMEEHNTNGGRSEGVMSAAVHVPYLTTSTNSALITATGGCTQPVRLGVCGRPQDAKADSSGLSPPPVAPVTIPTPSASSVTLFTTYHYKTTVESVHAADCRKRGGGHQEMSRAGLQQRLHNYFDSSVTFLLNHAEQSKLLLRRLEMVALLDADAQRTSVTLSLNNWQGSPTSMTSSWRHGNNSSASSSFSPEPSSTAACVGSPAGLSKAASFQKHVDPTAVENGVTSCSHFSVADDILRKFFTSLTTEFLTPVTAWFQKVTQPYTAFHLCDRALCDSLLSPASFLNDFALRHRETAPLMWTQLHSYKTYKLMYERFANGCLFKAYVSELIEEDLRRQLNGFQIEEWLVRVPSEAERIDLLINLFNTIQRELNETLDPDVLLVTSATSVMASMAVVLHEPHREQFMLKIGDLKL